MSKRVVLTLFVIGMLLLLLVQNAGKTTWSMRGNRSWKGDSSAYMYDNVTTHYGNLIVDGTQTFVIENCRYIQIGDILVKGYAELQLKDCEFVLNQSTYYQWNISVNENAQLHSENVSITSNFSYDQFYDDESIVTFNETNLDTFCWIYGNGASLTFHNSSDSGDILVSTQVLFVNSSAEFVSTYPDAAVMIENSTMDFVSVGTKNSSVIARNLGGTYVSRFNTFENLTITGGRTSNVTVITSTLCISFEAYWEASSLAIYDSYIKGVAVAFGSEVFIDMCDGSGQGFDLSIQNSTAVIYNSNISYIVSTLNSVFSVYNSTISYGIHFYGGSDRGYCFECRISEIDVQSFGGTIMMDRTEVFGGPVGVYRYVEDSQFYVSGNISFTGNSHVMEWKNSTVTRSFVTSCRNKTSPLENAMLTLYDSSRSVVWSGLSDPDGRAEFNLTFTDSNYTDTLRLEAVKGEWYGTSNVSFLSDTPVTLTLGTHDIAITDVAPSKTVVGHDYLALIMVTVRNLGTLTDTETFNVTAYYNETAIMIEQWPDGEHSQSFWSMGDVNRDGYIDNWDLYTIKMHLTVALGIRDGIQTSTSTATE